MRFNYDISEQRLLHRLMKNKDLAIGLDLAEGEDECIEVTFCIRNKDEILTVETLKIKE